MPIKQLESPPYHSKSHLSHPSFSLNLNTQRVCSQLSQTFSFLVFCGFTLSFKAVMCLQVPGLGMYSPVSAAAASLYSLALQDLASPQPFLEQWQSRIANKAMACPSGLQQHYLGSVIWAWIVKICIEKEPFKEKSKCLRKIHFCDIFVHRVQPSHQESEELDVFLTKLTQLLEVFKQDPTPKVTLHYLCHSFELWQSWFRDINSKKTSHFLAGLMFLFAVLQWFLGRTHTCP